MTRSQTLAHESAGTLLCCPISTPTPWAVRPRCLGGNAADVPTLASLAPAAGLPSAAAAAAWLQAYSVGAVPATLADAWQSAFDAALTSSPAAWAANAVAVAAVVHVVDVVSEQAADPVRLTPAKALGGLVARPLESSRLSVGVRGGGL